VSHASTAAGIWSPLIRAALIVTDLERSQRFYRELFGLDEVHSCGDTRSDTMFADPDGVKLNVIERDPHEALALHGPGLVL